jgi:hypothetical protein
VREGIFSHVSAGDECSRLNKRVQLYFTLKTSRSQRQSRDTDGLHRMLAKKTGRDRLVNVVERLTFGTRPAVEAGIPLQTVVMCWLNARSCTPAFDTPRWERLG